MARPSEVLQRGDALLIVDVQVDFCPGGALPIEEGDAVVPVLNRWIEAAASTGVPVFVSRDWHPHRHMSFTDAGGQWPRHCVEDTTGAAFHPRLDVPADAVVVTKGEQADREQYSAFNETGLANELRRRGVRRVWVGGLAQDVCVRATALDALGEGFDVRLIVDGTRPVTAEGGRQALEDLTHAGARCEVTE